MELLTHKIPVSYSKKEKLVIYIAGVLAISLLAYMGYYQYKRCRDTIENGIHYKARIIDVGCGGGTKSRLYFRNLKNVKKHVNVSQPDCLKFKAGDSIFVFENKTEDWYEIDPGSLLDTSVR